jgi:hypothetical protein
MHSIPRRLAALLLLTVVIGPIGAPPQARAAQTSPPAADQGAPTVLPLFVEDEQASPNDDPASANQIGLTPAQRWSQPVQGTIGGADDVDYYRFELRQPASKVRLALDGLAADYDLVLAGGPAPSQGFDPGQPGLEGVTEIGSSISAIGSSISAIGSSISAIGSSISAIGSSISAIGSSISAISAQSGVTAESIDTFIWLPGTYYAVVAPSNGQFAPQPYSLTVQVDGSGLGTAPPAPEVELRGSIANAADITTLYIVNSARMGQLYPGQQNQINSFLRNLDTLATSAPPFPNGAGFEYGVVLDIADLVPQAPNTRTISDTYQLWAANQGNPLYANHIAGIIDNVIEATRDDANGGNSTPPEECPPTGCLIPPGYILGSTTAPPLVLPNLRNVVLVGGDEVIPFFRLPDLTTIANEADYLAYLQSLETTGIIDPNNPQGAALRYRMITSDNPYGSGRPYRFYGFPFFLPSLAVGRIVESPDDIDRFFANALNNSFSSINIQPIDGAPRAAVTGYDFLKDQAATISETLLQTGLFENEINGLIDDRWTSEDLEREWFDGQLDTFFSDQAPNAPGYRTPIPLSSINAHFDHWQVLPAQDTTGNFPARRLLAPDYSEPGGGYFVDSLGYSVGCHSGFNVIDRSIAPGTANASLYAADFAQALNRHGGSWIGNTGYGYGTADGIDYSERLATLLTTELARDVQGGFSAPVYVGQSVGEALRNAKQRYVRNATSLSPYDYKALHIMTLYGLPYVRSYVNNPIAPPPEDPAPSRDAPLETQAPYAPDSLGRLTRVITFTLSITDTDDRTIVPRTGSTVLTIGADDFVVEDEFVIRGGGGFPQPVVRTFANNQVGAPSLPTFAYDISAASGISATERLRVKDVIFLGGQYGQLESFNPQVTQVVTETSAPIVNTGQEPEFDAGIGIWFPDKFFSFSSVGEGEQQRDQLVAAAAQFRADATGRTGLLRPYGKMVFQVIYDDPGRTTAQANTLRQDETPPLIESVRIEFKGLGAQNALAQSGQARVLVRTFDGGPDPDGRGAIVASDISAVYILNGVNWELARFTRLGPQLFAADLNVAAGSVRVIVRVTDRAGNTSYYTAKGTFTPPLDVNLLRLPMLRR